VIASTPCTTLVGAPIKFRRLADPAMGIETGEALSDAVSVRHAQAVIERELSARDQPSEISFGEPDKR
jgi:hypothetical protein